MSKQPQTRTRAGNARWFILSAAGVFVIAAWSALAVGYFMRPGLAVWTLLVTIAALSLEVLMWTAAGVFAWGFLAKRRATLDRWRRRLFGDRGGAESDVQP